LVFKRIFLGTLADYDGKEYVSQVEAYTTIPEDVERKWSFKSTLTLLEKGAPYSMMFYSRIVRTPDNRNSYLTLLVCKTPHHWDTILLPLIRDDDSLSGYVFCTAIRDNKRALMDWIFEREMFSPRIDISMGAFFGDYIKKSLKGFEYLKQKQRIYDSVWERIILDIFRQMGNVFPDHRKHYLVRLLEIAGFVPSSICKNIVYYKHLMFTHVCGCHVVLPKRQKGMIPTSSFF
jgi:hypothetical protein